MLKEQVWRWEHDGNDWELIVEYDMGLIRIWLKRDDLYAAKMLVSPMRPQGIDLDCRRCEPWPEEVQRQFDEVVAAARKSVR